MEFHGKYTDMTVLIVYVLYDYIPLADASITPLRPA